MAKPRHSEEKVLEILGRIENGESIAVVSRTSGISRKTIQYWKATYGHQPKTDDAKRLKQLKDENARLKKLVADLALDNAMLKDVVGKKPQAERSSARRW
ncbi:transposase [Deinococcus peraridilitoris]|uniref:Transposase n=1 Tax=Deinococcus peraridilitoris (strain DSM 19664 / LMG 22246 / CIP 109416 / KR-200) TaxID=937777 RepID=L0A6U6_DEIPD|nr:transposase [Deinococcus peraridilitoris]AFZ69561.1 Transposase [Deinococcus peraridilitoris DSM 19664]